MNDPASPTPCHSPCGGTGPDRRNFLFAAGATVVALNLPGCGTAQAQVARYARTPVGRLSELRVGRPLEFRYPWDHLHCTTVLLKLGQEAAGGVGPGKDVVAFNGICPHMGWEIPSKAFFADPGVAGPCPGHWTTFDLTRHGMVVSGHATQGLPQVTLEVVGDTIVATGVLGLIFGFHDNGAAPRT